MDDDDERVFNAIIVISDRRVLNKQLQATVRAYEKTRGLVAVIDGTSAQLKEALESGKQIIVTTLQKFPVIVDSVGKLSGSGSPFSSMRPIAAGRFHGTGHRQGVDPRR